MVSFHIPVSLKASQGRVHWKAKDTRGSILRQKFASFAFNNWGGVRIRRTGLGNKRRRVFRCCGINQFNPYKKVN